MTSPSVSHSHHSCETPFQTVPGAGESVLPGLGVATYWTHDSPPCNHRRPETDSLTPCRCETGPTHDCTSRAISPSAPAQRIHFVCIHQSVDFKRGSRLSLLLDETWTVFSTPSRALEASALPCSSSLQLLSEHYLSTKKATFATPLKFCIDSAGC